MNFLRLSSFFTMLLIAGAIVASGYCLWQLWELRQEHKRLVQTEVRMREDLAMQQEDLRRNERILERLRTDPAYVELTIRRRLGYAKPGELIFRFEDDSALTNSGSATPLR